MNKAVAVSIALAALVLVFVYLLGLRAEKQDALLEPSLCEGQQKDVGVSCQEALASALEQFPGEATSVVFETVQFQEGPDGESSDIRVWLVDVNLRDPVVTPVGQRKRAVVAVDTASILEPFVKTFYPEAL